jgi:hypothetical protein
MAKYAVDLQRTASAAASVGNWVANVTRPRRNKWYDILLGSQAAAADNPFLYTIQRCTTQGTATAVVPQAIDPADAATESVAGENHTAEPTYTAAAILLNIGLNQRATFRWIASPGGELVTPATANNGLGIQTPTSSAIAVTAQIHGEEQ